MYRVLIQGEGGYAFETQITKADSRQIIKMILEKQRIKRMKNGNKQDN